MRRRKKNLRQWVAVPALASLGITLVAYGQNLVLEEVSLAAPARPVAAAAAPRAAKDRLTAGAPAATGSAATTEGNPEFGSSIPGGTSQVQQPPGRIHSTSQDEMVRRARENSGREDPFVTLVLPQAVVIQPIAPPAPPPQMVVVRPGIPAPRAVQVNPVTGRRQTFVDGQWVDEIIQNNPDDPRWSVQGIINTGRESQVILEQDGTTYEAHIGEILPDGAKVVAISGSQVTLLAHGRRYVKTIGGLEPQ